MFPAATKKGGQCMATPDVCYLPAPPPPPAGPGGIPTPYPNVGMVNSTDKCTKDVLIQNKECVVEDSEIPSTKGDELGCSTIVPPGQKGLMSMKNMDKMVYKKHSSKVKLEGKGAVTHTALTAHNGSNANMPAGGHTVPSQTKVIIKG